MPLTKRHDQMTYYPDISLKSLAPRFVSALVSVLIPGRINKKKYSKKKPAAIKSRKKSKLKKIKI